MQKIQWKNSQLMDKKSDSCPSVQEHLTRVWWKHACCSLYFYVLSIICMLSTRIFRRDLRIDDFEKIQIQKTNFPRRLHDWWIFFCSFTGKNLMKCHQPLTTRKWFAWPLRWLPTPVLLANMRETAAGPATPKNAPSVKTTVRSRNAGATKWIIISMNWVYSFPHA